MLSTHAILAPIALLIATVFGCSDEEPASINIALIPGQESYAFHIDPKPEKLVLHAVGLDGTSTKVFDKSWPDGTATLSIDPDQQVAIDAYGHDASGSVVLRGSTVFHKLWQQAGTQLPVFLGRVGTVSRPPSSQQISHVGGVASVIDGRFVVAVGGDEAFDRDGDVANTAAFASYDLAYWESSMVTETLPREPRSLVIVQGRWGLVIDGTGASWFDFFTFESTPVDPPAGLSFSEVVGGLVLHGEDGEAYLVGPSRKNSPSSAVLRVDWDGTLRVIRTGVERVGAAAVYVVEHGLLLVGGHPSEPGVLLLNPKATAFAALPYPADSVEGAMAVSIGDGRVLLGGGVSGGLAGDDPASVRVIDIRCLAECDVLSLESTADHLGFSHGWAAATGPSEALFVGEDPHGVGTVIKRISGLDSTPVVEEIPMREPRIGGSPVAVFGQGVAILGGRKTLGGGIPSVEVYIPR
ncbi:MAG: hypothetical protein FWD57_13780 [Polyangiaceae bacterium]|nr:hypothetical protein [Polyangiaceae bacterium]